MMKFNILRIIKLARNYSKAKKLLKKDSPDIMKLAECMEDLRNSIVDLEEGKNACAKEIKNIKTIITELRDKIKEGV